MREEIVPVGGGRIDMRVQVAGEGPPLVFLHNAGGMVWDPFLEEIARTRTVYAPLVPGTSPADPDAIDEVLDLWELVLCEQEALSALGLEGADLVGSPATVRDRLEAVCREMKVGNLLTMMHMGEMPHELAEKSVRLFSDEVLPHLKGMWERDGYEHRWWPTGVPAKAAA